MIILSFYFYLKKIFKSFVIPLIFTFITDYFAKKKKRRPHFLKSKLHIYIFYNFFDLVFFFFLLLFNIVFLKFQTLL